LNHSLLLSTYYFFPICYTTPNDLKFFKHVYNLTWRMNPKSSTILDIFSYHCDFVKCCCLIFHRAKMKIFVNSNINIFQSIRWKFLKFFPHLLKLAYYKILQLDVSENISFLKFGRCTRSVNFGAFLMKTQSNTFRG